MFQENKVFIGSNYTFFFFASSPKITVLQLLIQTYLFKENTVQGSVYSAAVTDHTETFWKNPFSHTSSKCYQRHIVKHMLCYKIWFHMPTCETILDMCYWYCVWTPIQYCLTICAVCVSVPTSYCKKFLMPYSGFVPTWDHGCRH